VAKPAVITTKTYIKYDKQLSSMIIGKIRERSDGHRYVTIPKEEDNFETGDNVKIENLDNKTEDGDNE
jgi:hypothetical protein